MDIKTAETLAGARVSTDTRTIGAGDVFFALKGVRFDGHDFLAQAVEKGARHLVVSDRKKAAAFLNAPVNLVFVEDTLAAYGDLAKFHRAKFKIPAVAITGSSGKTTVKELVAHVLSAKFKVLKNRGTENNLVGLPKTIFQLEDSHQILVLEMGTNRPGEIERLASILGPQVGIVTQIGPSHLEGLRTVEGVREEKLKIIPQIERGGYLILNGEDPMLADVQSGVHRVWRVGFSKEADSFWADHVWCHESGASFHLNGKDLFETKLVGRHNVLNCLLAIAVASSFGIETASVQKSLADFKPVPGRLSLRDLDGILFLDDSYNSNPLSFQAAIQTLKSFKTRGKKGVVCGDMLELGESSEAMHRRIGSELAAMLFDFIVAAGPASKSLVDEAVKSGFDPARIHHAKDGEEAGKICRTLAAAGDIVLVKGSRGMQMEKVFECFITSSTR